MTSKEVLEFAKKNDAKQLDLRFTDIPSLQHHVSYPISELDESSFEDGFGMDGSSIRGWAAIHESDMLLIPDPETALMDPFAETPTLVMIGDVQDPITKQRYERDPRWIARKAEMYLTNSGVADTAYFGAEAEFFIFDNISFDQTAQFGVLLHRRRRRAVELGAAGEQPGVPAAVQGRVFPGAADGSLPGSAQRDGADDDPVRDPHRVPSP